jgi:crotonobetainyl-CoA:carnitine CoA-transferase CaiB-like acyl-CoA transferase
VVATLLVAGRHRLRTGAGQAVEIALKDVAAAMLGHLGIVGEVVVNGVDRPKAGNALYGAYGKDFLCADGRRVMVVALTDRQWRGLTKVTGTAEAMSALAARLGLDLAEEANRYRARAEITAILQPWFAARGTAEIGAVLDDGGVAWSVFRTFAEAVREDPDLSPENPLYTMVEEPGIGRLPVPGLPYASTAAPREAARPRPRRAYRGDPRRRARPWRRPDRAAPRPRRGGRAAPHRRGLSAEAQRTAVTASTRVRSPPSRTSSARPSARRTSVTAANTRPGVLPMGSSPR